MLKSLTPRVKLWAIQSFLTFDSMDGSQRVKYIVSPNVRMTQRFRTFDYTDRTLKCDHSLKSY